MHDKLEKMMRDTLAQALRDVATKIEEEDASRPTNWPCLKTLGQPEKKSQSHGSADVYVAGCSALSELAQRFQIPIFKIGATQQPLLTRQSDLCADRYAAAFRRGGKLVCEPGFDDWEMRRLDPIDAPGSGLEFVPRALRVDLTKPFAPFETALRRALRPHALITWASSAAGRNRLKSLGSDEEAARRFTLYGFGDQVRSSPCNELYVLRPRVDMSMICRAVGVALSTSSSQQSSRLICQPNAISLSA